MHRKTSCDLDAAIDLAKHIPAGVISATGQDAAPDPVTAEVVAATFREEWGRCLDHDHGPQPGPRPAPA